VDESGWVGSELVAAAAGAEPPHCSVELQVGVSLGTTDDLLAAIRCVGTEADELLTVADAIADEYLTGTAPFQDDVHARALVFDYLVGYARVSADWAARAEQYVAQWNALDDDQRADAGVDLIRRSETPRGPRSVQTGRRLDAIPSG
jgi:hypothetical protein